MGWDLSLLVTCGPPKLGCGGGGTLMPSVNASVSL